MGTISQKAYIDYTTKNLRDRKCWRALWGWICEREALDAQ